MNPIFTKMVDTIEAANAAPDDYINPANGLKYCGKCRTPKEAFYPADLQAQGFTKHPVMCKCAAERREREETERREYERMSYMTMLRSEAFRDMPAAGWRFESAAVTTPQLAKAPACFCMKIPLLITARINARASMPECSLKRTSSVATSA